MKIKESWKRENSNFFDDTVKECIGGKSENIILVCK